MSICISVSAEGASDDSAGSEGASSRTSSSSSCGRGTAEASANSSGFRSKAVGAGIVVRILGGNRCVFFFRYRNSNVGIEKCDKRARATILIWKQQKNWRKVREESKQKNSCPTHST